ncbi:MAG TPA: hypothetical protein VGN20_12335 [Mucilaginibacter sp.]|jgi:hypothetical protein
MKRPVKSPEAKSLSEKTPEKKSEVRRSEVGNPKSEDQTIEQTTKSEIGYPISDIQLKSNPDNHWDENPRSEIKELPTANSQLPTEQMEVHHHPNVEKKNFKEYILEGLMIFLAVTMGFFAESIREGIADRSKENEYVISMIQDAKTDTANIRKCIAGNTKRVKSLDSLAFLCDSYDPKAGNDAFIYLECRHSIIHPDFVTLTDRTMAQLKSAGGMRLIKRKIVADSIITYDDFSKKLIDQQNYYERYLNEAAEMGFKVFNWKYFNASHAGSTGRGYQFTSAKLLTTDKLVLIELANKEAAYAGVVAFYVTRLKEANRHAVNLINTLKKQYNLEDE